MNHNDPDHDAAHCYACRAHYLHLANGEFDKDDLPQPEGDQ